jgi:hypothetical protein
MKVLVVLLVLLLESIRFYLKLIDSEIVDRSELVDVDDFLAELPDLSAKLLDSLPFELLSLSSGFLRRRRRLNGDRGIGFFVAQVAGEIVVLVSGDIFAFVVVFFIVEFLVELFVHVVELRLDEGRRGAPRLRRDSDEPPRSWRRIENSAEA